MNNKDLSLSNVNSDIANTNNINIGEELVEESNEESNEELNEESNKELSEEYKSNLDSKIEKDNIKTDINSLLVNFPKRDQNFMTNTDYNRTDSEELDYITNRLYEKREKSSYTNKIKNWVQKIGYNDSFSIIEP